jgi:hypothetical protein
LRNWPFCLGGLTIFYFFLAQWADAVVPAPVARRKVDRVNNIVLELVAMDASIADLYAAVEAADECDRVEVAAELRAQLAAMLKKQDSLHSEYLRLTK